MNFKLIIIFINELDGFVDLFFWQYSCFLLKCYSFVADSFQPWTDSLFLDIISYEMNHVNFSTSYKRSSYYITRYSKSVNCLQLIYHTIVYYLTWTNIESIWFFIIPLEKKVPKILPIYICQIHIMTEY